MDPPTRNDNNNEITEGLPTYEEAIKMKPNIYIIQNENSRNNHDSSFPTQILNNTKRPIFSSENQGANSINLNINDTDNSIGIPKSILSENPIPITGPSMFLNYPNNNFDSTELQNISYNQNSSKRNTNLWKFFNCVGDDEDQALLITIMNICCFLFATISLIFYIFFNYILQKFNETLIFVSIYIFLFTAGLNIFTLLFYLRDTTKKYENLNIIILFLTLVTSAFPAILRCGSEVVDMIRRKY